MMLGANTVRALLLAALVLTVLLDAGSIWALHVVAFCAGTAETIYDTGAQSILPRLVPPDQLPRANARMYAAELTANEFRRPASVRADIAEGLRFLWRDPLLRSFTAITGGFNFASGATQAILVRYAVGSVSAVGLTEQAYGWLLSTVAVGSLVGSLVAERIVRRLGRARTLLFALLSSALPVGLSGVTPNPFLIGAAFFLGGGGIIIFNVVMMSLRQWITPDRLLGRVNSGHRVVGWGTRPR